MPSRRGANVSLPRDLNHTLLRRSGAVAPYCIIYSVVVLKGLSRLRPHYARPGTDALEDSHCPEDSRSNWIRVLQLIARKSAGREGASKVPKSQIHGARATPQLLNSLFEEHLQCARPPEGLALLSG